MKKKITIQILTFIFICINSLLSINADNKNTKKPLQKKTPSKKNTTTTRKTLPQSNKKKINTPIAAPIEEPPAPVIPAEPIHEPEPEIQKPTIHTIMTPDAHAAFESVARAANMNIEEFFTQYITLFAITIGMQMVHREDIKDFSSKLMTIKADDETLSKVLSQNMEKIINHERHSSHNANTIPLLSENIRKLILFIAIKIGDKAEENNVCRDTFNMICDRYKHLFIVNGSLDKNFKNTIYDIIQSFAKSPDMNSLIINLQNGFSENSLAGTLFPQLLNFIACPPTQEMTSEASAYADLSNTLLSMILLTNGINMNELQFEKLSPTNYAYIAKWVVGGIAAAAISALVVGAILRKSGITATTSKNDGWFKRTGVKLAAFTDIFNKKNAAKPDQTGSPQQTQNNQQSKTGTNQEKPENKPDQQKLMPASQQTQNNKQSKTENEQKTPEIKNGEQLKQDTNSPNKSSDKLFNNGLQEY